MEEYYKKITKPSAEKEKLEEFFALLSEYNARYNLTAIKEKKEVYVKHFLDSLAGEFLFERGASVLEVGSGAGFPSLVLKIFRQDLRFTLLESIAKKCEFLRVATEKLSLSDVQIVNDRAENFAKTKARESFDVVCARAVARMNTLSEYCLPFVKKGGLFVAYKGREEEEITESGKAIFVLGGKIKATYAYELPENYGYRTLVAVEKIKPTPAKYPRGNGQERKNPIV